ncbi:MAG TPA: heparinase II/III family protein [Microvirga sp.]|nr:heparinase II/III family protein [Microvirga sp.]
MHWAGDRWRLYRLAASEAGRAVRGGIAWRLAGWRLGTPTPSRLLFAPQDLRTADPTVAGDIYAGFFAFAGRSVSTGGQSPFDIDPPSRAWGEALYGFGWLRHLRAAGTALAQANARSLVDEFIAGSRGHRRFARETHILARRAISFMSQSPLILEGADRVFYNRFLRALGRAAQELERDARAHPLPHRRLVAAIALCYVALCSEGLEGPLRRATRLLVRELDRQILPDGGHTSRNPRVLIDLLFDLLPLRQIYASRGLDVPEALLHAIDRMLPMLRLFRHGDGTLSHFNGMGVTAADQLATLLIYDDLRSEPIHHAPHSGYERLEAGGTLLVADVGGLPPVEQAGSMGAGCLSFEMSSRAQRIVVNCGLPRHPSEGVVQAARATAAHSTAVLGDASSARILQPGGPWPRRRITAWLMRRLGPAAHSGPAAVTAERSERDHAQTLTASHDGYRRRFGLVHERRWRLAADGGRLEGEDHFRPVAARAAGEDAVIRFHLAPGIKASRTQGGRVIMLVLPNREAWQFEVSPGVAQVEDSMYFAAPDGPRRSEQIVVAVNTAEHPEVRWRFDRLSRAPSPAPSRRNDTAELL